PAAPYTCAMINPLATDWPIKQRSEICNATHRPFTPGEVFYTLLYREGDGFRREDLCKEAWRDRNENIQPFSFWKTKFEPAPPPAPEALPKENAEQLFRRLITEPDPPANACFVLAVMLERKRVLKQEDASQLFPRPITNPDPTANSCFVHAVMLERKRDLKQVRTEIANGDRLLIYEHRENGDVFIVRDPQLRQSEEHTSELQSRF